MIAFLLDENVNIALRAALHQQMPEVIVWSVGEFGAPALGTLDPAILDWCEEGGFILVTNNRRSMPNHLSEHLKNGRHMPRILTLGQEPNFHETIQDMALIAGAGRPDEFMDRIRFLPLRD